YADAAMTLSNILRDKTATVVLHDYCLSACASYVLVATRKTYVKKNTIVAWHDVGPQKYPMLSEYDCAGFGVERLLPEYHDRYRAISARGMEVVCRHNKLYREFFKQRGIDDRHIYAPQTFYTRKMVRFATK